LGNKDLSIVHIFSFNSLRAYYKMAL